MIFYSKKSLYSEETNNKRKKRTSLILEVRFFYVLFMCFRLTLKKYSYIICVS